MLLQRRPVLRRQVLLQLLRLWALLETLTFLLLLHLTPLLLQWVVDADVAPRSQRSPKRARRTPESIKISTIVEMAKRGTRKVKGSKARKTMKGSKSGKGGKTEWMTLVKKHLASGKKFGDALKAAKAEYRK